MTSFRQLQTNRRNALRSTGPTTEGGKRRSRCNAVRHGLTAETVIGALEDAEDYKKFEATIIDEYEAETAVERELVLRLASLLWRLRRATAMETGLFEMNAGQHDDAQRTLHASAAVYMLFKRTEPSGSAQMSIGPAIDADTAPTAVTSNALGTELARCFIRLADQPNYALDRLSRYEASLWRQAGQILFALDGRRNPQARRPSFFRGWP